jgi:hypothetical protein
MAKITFEIPDDFIPTKGVCMLSGWAGNPPIQQLKHIALEETTEWDALTLYREGARRGELIMQTKWLENMK